MDDLLARLGEILGPGGLLTGAEVTGRRAGPWAGSGTILAKAIARPRETAQVAAVMKLCHEARQPVIPFGGLTGLVHGTASGPDDLLLSLELMNQIEHVDPVGRTMQVQAGCLLQRIQEAAEHEGLLFPLDLGARGSCTIGGNVSTNAGGNRVIRFGMTRELVLGLEAVLADGTVISSMNSMLKNNAGFDLKQLFIGTEGVLGIVTRLVLRLREAPASQNTAFVAFADFPSVTAFLKHVDRRLGGNLSAFEVLWRDVYDLLTSPPATGRPPLERGAPFYALVESLGGDQESDDIRFTAALEAALESGLIVDAAIARNLAERNAMWGIRDDVGQFQRFAPVTGFDVSLPIRDMDAYGETLARGIRARWPEGRVWIFGHLGDGNLHVVVGVGSADEETKRAVDEIVYRPLAALGGSVSAEHGIGLDKKPHLGLSRNAEEITLMRRLKAMLDPRNILNPGKVLEMP
ncbi:MAG: FAD-binding oxidoreductase [Alphaproteobacteria bacterium]|nr:FAD-binding oxidoreductase [Alphaproteobacteria bacterium]